MLRLGVRRGLLALAALLTAAAATTWAGDVQRLDLRPTAADPGQAAASPIQTLRLTPADDSAADTLAVHYRRWGGFHGGFHGGFYRPHYVRPYWGYYRPYVYRPYVVAPRYYYYPRVYGGYGAYYSTYSYPTYYSSVPYYGVTLAAPSVSFGLSTSPGYSYGPAPAPPPSLAVPANPGATYPYDGGPVVPVPTPQTIPPAVPGVAPTAGSAYNRVVSLPQSGAKYAYPAYGEPSPAPRSAPAVSSPIERVARVNRVDSPIQQGFAD
jgi:hypothetical protein